MTNQRYGSSFKPFCQPMNNGSPHHKKKQQQTYIITSIFDHNEYWAVQANHVPVQCMQRESVLVCAVDQRPGVTDCATWHHFAQLKLNRKCFTFYDKLVYHVLYLV